MSRGVILGVLLLNAVAGSSAFAYIPGRDPQADRIMEEKARRKAEYAAAFKPYNDAVARDPHDPLAYYQRGRFRRSRTDLGNVYSKALRDFDTAIRLNPQFGRAYFERWDLKRHRDDEITLDLRIAAECGDCPAAQMHYAWEMMRWADPKSPSHVRAASLIALRYAQRACDATERKNPVCNYVLATVYRKLGDSESAEKWEQLADRVNLNALPMQALFQPYLKRPPLIGRSVPTMRNLDATHAALFEEHQRALQTKK